LSSGPPVIVAGSLAPGLSIAAIISRGGRGAGGPQGWSVML
jgi:hypothetical protein